MNLRIRNDAVSWTPTDDGGIVILDLRHSRYLSLNPAASTLWPLMVDGTEADRLREALVSGYGISDDVAQRDVDVFLDALRERDLLAGP